MWRLIRTAIFTLQARIRVLSQGITGPLANRVNQGCQCLFLRVLISIGICLPGPLFHRPRLRQTVSSKLGKPFLHRMAICMSRIVLPIAYGSMRRGPVTFCEILFREATSSINRSIYCSVQTVVIFLLEAAVTIQFSDMILAKTPQPSLSCQNRAVLMALLEWHSAKTVSFTLPVAIQRRSSATMAKMADHPVGHSSRISQTTRNF